MRSDIGRERDIFRRVVKALLYLPECGGCVVVLGRLCGGVVDNTYVDALRRRGICPAPEEASAAGPSP